MKRFYGLAGTVLAMIGLALSTTGCLEMAVGATAAGGVAAAQERSVGGAIDDKTLLIRVNEKILRKDERLFGRVDVDVLESRVLLTGVVPTPEDRVEAARLAWQADGVKEVLNELQVDDKSGILDFAKDSWITTQLRAKMLADRFVFDINYTIDTVNGTVYVLGIAQNQAELERVTNHARNLSGVRKVISHAKLKTDASRGS